MYLGCCYVNHWSFAISIWGGSIWWVYFCCQKLLECILYNQDSCWMRIMNPYGGFASDLTQHVSQLRTETCTRTSAFSFEQRTNDRFWPFPVILCSCLCSAKSRPGPVWMSHRSNQKLWLGEPVHVVCLIATGLMLRHHLLRGDCMMLHQPNYKGKWFRLKLHCIFFPFKKAA